MHDHNLADRHRSPAGRVTKDGIDFTWADYGPHYVKVRKVCTLALFTSKKIEAYRPIREDEVNAVIESLFNDCTNPENKGKALTIKGYTGLMSFNNITRLTFGKRCINSKGELDVVGRELKSISFERRVIIKNTNILLENLPWLQWLFFPLNNKYKEQTANFNARVGQFIRETIEEHVITKSKNIGGTKQNLIDSLLTFKDEYDLGEEIIYNLLWDMFFGGGDTIGITVEWALAELIRNPRVKNKAQNELDQVIGSGRIMTEDDFSNLPYLKAIVKETLRLHPSTPLLLPHMAKSHVKIAGYDIPKGSVIRVNVWALGRDPNVWGDVNEFRPERFFEEDVDIKGHDFRLLPFRAGRRICPGAQVAINMVTSTLGCLLHHFEWNPPNGVKVEEIDMREESLDIICYMKTPLQAVIVPRLPTSLYTYGVADV